jgi:type VI secretion system protein ImpJ
MFLRPHHLQAAQRHQSQSVHQSEKWDHHYDWGLRVVDLDLDALANYHFVVRSLKGRLHDGTLVAIPEDGLLPALDLKPVLEHDPTVTIFLGVPVLRPGRANVSAPDTAEGPRYLLDTQDLEDENTGQNPQPVQVRLLNLKLLLPSQDHSGYEILPIARIERSSRADATPQLDASYIPPVLACDAWHGLEFDILRAIHSQIGNRIELRATQVVARGITFDSRSQDEPRMLAQLQELNEAYALLGILAFAQGIHPLLAYLELCRIVGQLAIFGPTRRPPDLRKYDHDDLGGCFYQVKQHIHDLLNTIEPPKYHERPFVGAGLRMQVSLEPAWLELGSQILVGVQSPLSTEECVRLLTKSGQLEMKIGSSDRVDEIYRLGQAGLKFAYIRDPPGGLPVAQGLTYLQVSRESQLEEWQNVLRSLTLAIRLNENRIAGNIQGQQVLKIKTGGQTTTLQFTLYVVPQGQ